MKSCWNDWIDCFFILYSQQTFRNPEVSSMTQVPGLNQNQVDSSYMNLHDVIMRQKAHCYLPLMDILTTIFGNYIKALSLILKLLSIPPLTSRRLEPFCKLFFGPLETSYNQECSKFITQYPGKRIITSDIVKLSYFLRHVIVPLPYRTLLMD